MWQYNVSQNRFRAIHSGGRVFEIEPSGPQPHAHWALWFRREEPPYRSLLIGRFPTVDAAKAAAEDVAQQIADNRDILED